MAGKAERFLVPVSSEDENLVVWDSQSFRPRNRDFLRIAPGKAVFSETPFVFDDGPPPIEGSVRSRSDAPGGREVRLDITPNEPMRLYLTSESKTQMFVLFRSETVTDDEAWGALRGAGLSKAGTRLLGFAPVRLLAEGGFVRTGGVEERGWSSVQFAFPGPGSLTLADYLVTTPHVLGGRTVQVATIPGPPPVFVWSEPDGLEVACDCSDISSLAEVDAAVRRVDLSVFSQALRDFPLIRPSPLSKAWPRDEKRGIPSEIVFAEGFLLDSSCTAVSSGVVHLAIDGRPIGAVAAAIKRVSERLGELGVDGGESASVDFDSAVDSVTSTERTITVELTDLEPPGRLTLMRIIREELAFAGVTEALIR